MNTKRVRGFEKVFDCKQSVKLPQRATDGSAGYDIRADKTVKIPSFIQQAWYAGNSLDTYYFKYLKPVEGYSDGQQLARFHQVFAEMAKENSKYIKPVLVPTGVKAYFPRNEVLKLYNRSSNPLKRGLVLANGTGIIDSDYYNNPSNDGELMAEFINISTKDYTIHKGDRIMQGVFEPYLLADDDRPLKVHRRGGLGSSGKN